MTAIELKLNLNRKGFDLDLDLQLPGQGVTAIFGRSGSGKTSLLRCLAGLEPACRGRIQVRGQIWQDGRQSLPTHKRPLGYVQQDACLFPHLSVRGNLEFALHRSPTSTTSFEQVVEIFNLQNLLDRDTTGLSGGERQRVAMARALLVGPELLLMDEPMASLDQQSKAEIFPYLEYLHGHLDVPICYVSHSADEVARLSDHLVVLDQGRVRGQGSLTEMLSSLNFPVQLGDDTGVVLQARILQHDPHWKLVRVATDAGELWVRDSGFSNQSQLRLRILARDVSLALNHHEDSSILNILPGKVDDIARERGGSSALVRVSLGRTYILSRITLRSAEHLMLRPGQRIWAQIKSVALVP